MIQLEKKRGRLFDTIAEALSGIVYEAERKNIGVTVECPEDVELLHDSKWTAEALFNLLDNGVKYTAAGGKIGISVELRRAIRHRFSGVFTGKKRYMTSRVWALGCILQGR